MKLVGISHLHNFGSAHKRSASFLAAWRYEVEEAHWKSKDDVVAQFQEIEFSTPTQVVFQMYENRIHLEVKISFETGVVLIKRVATAAESATTNHLSQLC